MKHKAGWMNFGRSDLPFSQFFLGLKWFLCCFQASPDHQHCVWKGLLLQKTPMPEAFFSLSEGPISHSPWQSPMPHACLSPCLCSSWCCCRYEAMPKSDDFPPASSSERRQVKNWDVPSSWGSHTTVSQDLDMLFGNLYEARQTASVFWDSIWHV